MKSIELMLILPFLCKVTCLSRPFSVGKKQWPYRTGLLHFRIKAFNIYSNLLQLMCLPGPYYCFCSKDLFLLVCCCSSCGVNALGNVVRVTLGLYRVLCSIAAKYN